MANFKLEDYEPVDARLKRALGEHPEMSVKTEIVSPIEQANEWVVIKATIDWGGSIVDGLVRSSVLSYTGIAHEKHGDGFVNKGSHVENCETSAIGRALANAGYSGDKRPSCEEMDKVNRSEAAQNQKAHFKDKEEAARQKIKDMIADNRGILGEDACIDYEMKLAEAKEYDAVVIVGKALSMNIKELTEGPPKTKREKAEAMTEEQPEIF